MRIALAQLNYTIGDFVNNTQRIIEQIKFGMAKSVDIVVFSELSVCGYPPLDFLENKDFIEKSNQSFDIVQAAHRNPCIITTTGMLPWRVALFKSIGKRHHFGAPFRPPD